MTHLHRAATQAIEKLLAEGEVTIPTARVDFSEGGLTVGR